jgi:hypothetical protein
MRKRRVSLVVAPAPPPYTPAVSGIAVWGSPGGATKKRPIEGQKGARVISKRMTASVAAAALVFAFGAPGAVFACDKQAKAEAKMAAEGSGCSKKAEAQVAANGVQADSKPCAKKAEAQVAANGVQADSKPCAKAANAEGSGCAKAKAAQIAKADEADDSKGETVARNGGR